MGTFLPETLHAPFIIDRAMMQWPARDWTIDHLAEMLGDKYFRCRLMPRQRENKGRPAWEGEGVYLDCQLCQFSAWCNGKAGEDNPLAPFSPLEFSGYIDYKYMTEVFADLPHLLEKVQWGSLGLCGVDGKQSTLWIGSPGASTPCHYDTYGFNLVAQVQGRKRWVLFPPNQSNGLYPTRVPYEESSVFSQVDLACPDLRSFPCFKTATPVVITLEAGQVLYVPRHWWHFVTCIETAVSINTWVEVPEDKTSHLQEAVTRVLASTLIPYLAPTAGSEAEDRWINPTEELESAESNVQYLKTALSSLPPLCARDTAQRSDTSQDNSVCSETPPSTAAAETEDNHDERYNHSETEHAEAETKMPGVGEASVIQASLAGRGERDPVGCDVGSGMTGLLQAEKDRKEASTKSVHLCSTDSTNFDIHEVQVSDMTVQGQLECSSVSAPEKVSDMTVQGQRECSSVSAPEKVSDMTVQGQLECSSVSAPEKVSDMTVQGQRECSSVSAPEKSDKSSAGVSSRLQQLARALVSSVLYSVQSPFSLTEFGKSHSPAPGKPPDSQSHLPCKASLKRKHQEHTEASSGDIHHELPPACHENDCTEKRQNSVSSPVNTKQHCRRGEEETVLGAEMCSDKDEARNSSEPVHRDKGREKSHLISTQRLPDSPRLQTTVYVPQPCAIEQYMKSIGEDIEKERDMCLPDEEESMSEERAEDKGERTGSSVEERLLQCVLHPDVVTLIAEKLLQYQTEIIT